MDPSQSYTPNRYLGDSFLNSKYFNPEYLFDHLMDFLRLVYDFIIGKGVNGFTLSDILAIFAIFFISVIAYASVRLLEIRTKERRHLAHEIAEYKERQEEKERKKQELGDGPRNERWSVVLQYLFSSNEGDWKLAVIEADAMLEDLMTELGFKGDGLGEKLKIANQDQFRFLTSAWEVHNIRNRIAHEGAEFGLSQHEAKRVVAIYEDIFRNFGYI